VLKIAKITIRGVKNKAKYCNEYIYLKKYAVKFLYNVAKLKIAKMENNGHEKAKYCILFFPSLNSKEIL